MAVGCCRLARLSFRERPCPGVCVWSRGRYHVLDRATLWGLFFTYRPELRATGQEGGTLSTAEG
jgi:hypothetical protein